jgi:hypothetical protein
MVRTALDVATLRANPGGVRKLPAPGLRVALEGVESHESARFEARIRAYIRSCGCAEGGIAALVGIGALLVPTLVSIYHRGPRVRDLGLLMGAVLLGAVLGGLGKLVGLTMARLRFLRSCDKILKMLNQDEIPQLGRVAK